MSFTISTSSKKVEKLRTSKTPTTTTISAFGIFLLILFDSNIKAADIKPIIAVGL